jgi:cyclophilin family peptidyl-prolyl cis-trans isomerase/HEAT repeat protein
METALVGVLVATLAGSSIAARPSLPAEGDLRQRILNAQERRAPTDADLQVLVQALDSSDVTAQRLAALAIGRLERPELVPVLVARLNAANPAVRSEVANAIGHALSVPASPSPSDSRNLTAAFTALLGRLNVEEDDVVRAVIARTLGRLPVAGSDLPTVETTLADEIRRARSNARSPAAAEGATKGLEWLLRTHARQLTPHAETIRRLKELVNDRPASAGGSEWTRARRLALSALSSIPDGVDDETLLTLIGPTGSVPRAAGDPDDEVRRLAVRAAALNARSAASHRTSSGQGSSGGDAVRPGGGIGAQPVTAQRGRWLQFVAASLQDPSPHVRYEALSALARSTQPPSCDPFLAGARDLDPHVALLAIDTLGACDGARESAKATDPATGQLRPVAELVRLTLVRLVQSPVEAGSWHRPAHALVSLAAVAPDIARRELPRFVGSRTWQVRTYAARAATVLKAGAVLRPLAADARDNVRTAAVTGLSEVEGHGADAVFVAQLTRADYELIMAAARALKGTRSPAAVPALVRALARLTAQRRDTSRDPRLAIIERLGEVGSQAQADALDPLTRDFDPRVARAAADLLTKWTGRRVAAETGAALPRPGIDAAEVARLDGAHAIVRLANGRRFVLALRAWEAPACTVRFARLARSGYYEGLTFHRIVPNFVVQGGSPAANEFVGDAVYWRDEVGLWSNERGTVGLSTRGRDTGDAQFYVNLVDNGRLDHSYTVFAAVVEGLDTVDAILEGDTIAAIRIVQPGGLTRSDHRKSGDRGRSQPARQGRNLPSGADFR